MSHCFDTYSRQVLSFKLSGQKNYEQIITSEENEKAAQRHLRFAEKRNAETIIIFGAGDGVLSQIITRDKSDQITLVTCDLYPEHIRKLNQNIFVSISESPNTHIIADSSIWAVLLLLLQNGITSSNSHLVLNPALKNDIKKEHQKLQKIFSGVKTTPLPDTPSIPKISAAAILSPDEPDLDSFISTFPDWLEEIVLLWDCATAIDHPQLNHDGGVKIINAHHPLEADFSAQRNRMLQYCTGEWIFYLDADERLDEAGWKILRQASAIKECNGWYLPRMTFYPDKKHCRMGYGLWPDLQLRLFRNTKQLVFVNKVHEQLNGFSGPSGILTAAPISHLTHLLKSRKNIESKLESFNKSTDGVFSHKLGYEYPYLTAELLNPSKSHSLLPVILPEFSL